VICSRLVSHGLVVVVVAPLVFVNIDISIIALSVIRVDGVYL